MHHPVHSSVSCLILIFLVKKLTNKKLADVTLVSASNVKCFLLQVPFPRMQQLRILDLRTCKASTFKDV